MKRLTYCAIGGIGLLALLTVGCTGPTRTELDFGTSHHLVKMNQIANPDAGQNLEPVTGLDGEAVTNEVDFYRKSFERPKSRETSITN